MKQMRDILIVFVGLVLFTAGCTGELNKVSQAKDIPGTNVAVGRQLIAQYGCGSCHTIPYVSGANGQVGPPLAMFYERSTIAGEVPNNLDNLVAWIRNPQSIEPHTDMPNLGVTADDARNIAAYLYHQPTVADALNR